MILVKISGGLGNQMYQYALICALRRTYPNAMIKGTIDVYKVQNVHYGFELNKVFRLVDRGELSIAGPMEQYKVRGEIPFLVGGKLGQLSRTPLGWVNARTRKRYIKKGFRNYINEDNIYADLGYNTEAFQYVQQLLEEIDITKNWYLDGYWINELYFEKVLPVLKEKFIFPDWEDENNRKLADKISASESVAIHIRRGDYVDTHRDILGMKYYQKSVEYIKSHVKNPVFFIFSEDWEYVRTNFTWLEPYEMVHCNLGENSYRDMQLMSICKHNITANSTFSAWGGYLNTNPNKIVIYPSRQNRTQESADILEKGWIKIDL